jgi:hypothetical protein
LIAKVFDNYKALFQSPQSGEGIPTVEAISDMIVRRVFQSPQSGEGIPTAQRHHGHDTDSRVSVASKRRRNSNMISVVAI